MSTSVTSEVGWTNVRHPCSARRARAPSALRTVLRPVLAKDGIGSPDFHRVASWDIVPLLSCSLVLRLLSIASGFAKPFRTPAHGTLGVNTALAPPEPLLNEPFPLGILGALPSPFFFLGGLPARFLSCDPFTDIGRTISNFDSV